MKRLLATLLVRGLQYWLVVVFALALIANFVWLTKINAEPPYAAQLMRAMQERDAGAFIATLSGESMFTHQSIVAVMQTSEAMGVVIDDVKFIDAYQTQTGSIAFYYARQHRGDVVFEYGYIVYLDRDGKVLSLE